MIIQATKKYRNSNVLVFVAHVSICGTLIWAYVSICGKPLQPCQVSNLLAYMGGAAGDTLGQSKIGGKWKNMEFSAKKTRSSKMNIAPWLR